MALHLECHTLKDFNVNLIITKRLGFTLAFGEKYGTLVPINYLCFKSNAPEILFADFALGPATIILNLNVL